MANTSLERVLEMARRSLAILETQAAGYGALTIPAHLQIELEEKRREMAELESRLQAENSGAGLQTTIGGYVTGPVLSGQFSGPVTVVSGGDVTLPLTVASGAPAVPLKLLRTQLQRLGDVEIDTLCLDDFPLVYDSFARGMRRDEKINLLLDHCRRNPEAAQRLAALLNIALADESPGG